MRYKNDQFCLSLSNSNKTNSITIHHPLKSCIMDVHTWITCRSTNITSLPREWVPVPRTENVERSVWCSAGSASSCTFWPNWTTTRFNAPEVISRPGLRSVPFPSRAHYYGLAQAGEHRVNIFYYALRNKLIFYCHLSMGICVVLEHDLPGLVTGNVCTRQCGQ